MNEESRRGFLQRFTEGLTSGSIEESRIGRALDFLVEQFGEAGILIALVALVSETNKDHLVQINIVPVDTWKNHAEQLRQVQDETTPVVAAFGHAQQQMAELGNLWRSRFYKSKTELYTDYEERCSGTGKDRSCITVPVLKSRTVYYWDEPADTSTTMNHHIIDGDNNYFGSKRTRLAEFLSRLPNVPFELRSLEDYDLSTSIVDSNTPNNWRLVAVMVAALGFANYEEFVSWLAKHEELSDDWQRLQKVGVTRRTFFKIIGATGAAALLNQLRQSSLQDNSQALPLVRTAAKNEIANSQIRADDARGDKSITPYLGENPAAIMAFLTTAKNRVQSTLGSRSIQQDPELLAKVTAVQESLNQLRLSSAKYLHFDDKDNYRLSPPVIQAYNTSLAHVRIESVVNSKNNKDFIDALGQIMAVLLTLAGTAVGAEAMIAFSNNLLGIEH